jgi:hypothetical protein
MAYLAQLRCDCRHLATLDNPYFLWLYPIIEHANAKEVTKMGRRRAATD